MALLLAFDLSTPLGSAAIGDADGILGERELVSEKRQAIELIPAIASLLDEVGRTPRDLQGIVVGRGPGSFTGVRIAAATARGMAASLEIPLWAPSSLAAGALSCGAEVGSDPRYVLFDARGDRVYAACYRMAGGGAGDSPSLKEFPEVLVPPQATTIQDVIGSVIPAGARFAGDGAARHAEALGTAGYDVLPLPLGMPSAAGLLQLVLLGALPSEEPGSRWEPDYIRGSSAVPLAER